MRFYSLGVVTSGDMRLAATQRPALRDDFTLQQSHLLTPGLNLTVINQVCYVHSVTFCIFLIILVWKAQRCEGH